MYQGHANVGDDEMSGCTCSLCFDEIRTGEHFVDENGDLWDTHPWCRLMDQAEALRREAMSRRAGHEAT